MKANELMIGDYITFKDCQQDDAPTIIRIAGILSNDTILASIDNCNALDEISTDELVGIPLTPEILEKNGFIKQGFLGWEIFESEKYMVLWRNDYPKTHLLIESFCSDYGSFSGFNINYVHQLQHALKLCKIEKTIEL